MFQVNTYNGVGPAVHDHHLGNVGTDPDTSTRISTILIHLHLPCQYCYNHISIGSSSLDLQNDSVVEESTSSIEAYFCQRSSVGTGTRYHVQKEVNAHICKYPEVIYIDTFISQ